MLYIRILVVSRHDESPVVLLYYTTLWGTFPVFAITERRLGGDSRHDEDDATIVKVVVVIIGSVVIGGRQQVIVLIVFPGCHGRQQER